jgi:hypothetical protein
MWLDSFKLAKAGDLSNLDRSRCRPVEPRSRSNKAHGFLLVALAVIAVSPALQMWHWVSSSWVPLPFWDEWHTPGSQFESWKLGTLTIKELFSQHNESRLFFPRLLYFSLEKLGGWDVRHEIRAVYLGVCGFCLLLLHLLRRTPGATPISILVGWTLMTSTCFAPVQVANFLYGIEIEPFIPGCALLLAAAVNLSRTSFSRKTLFNTLLGFVATYSFANGMLVWALAWPLSSPKSDEVRGRRWLWRAFYFAIGAISVSCYFIGYHRPSYHPPFVSLGARFFALLHYVVLWIGNYFASDLVGPFLIGICFLVLFCGAVSYAVWTGWRQGDWQTFYPWLLLGAFACGTAAITALGRLGFGVEQALDNRYVAFSRYFYIAFLGLCFAICAVRIRRAPPVPRAFLFTNVGWGVALFAVLWVNSFHKFAGFPAEHRKSRSHLLQALRWSNAIPDNPDLKLIFPYPEALRRRAFFLEKAGVLRLKLIDGPIVATVRQRPPSADGSNGTLESAEFQPGGTLRVNGWAWLPQQKRRADLVVLGAEDAAGNFKPLTLFGTGIKRPDLGARREPDGRVCQAGFNLEIAVTNLPADAVGLTGWAINLQTQQAFPLASSVRLPGRPAVALP